MVRQLPARSTRPPITGANTGATAKIIERMENRLAASTPRYQSLTTARASTMPAAPLAPSSSRAALSTAAFGAAAHSSEKSV